MKTEDILLFDDQLTEDELLIKILHTIIVSKNSYLELLMQIETKFLIKQSIKKWGKWAF